MSKSSLICIACLMICVGCTTQTSIPTMDLSTGSTIQTDITIMTGESTSRT
ncbi:hypothetical protein KAZ93_04030 [Patescibacteria group bacterium]|nr:hypothetical protein [Patescibacteria group bacterium]